MVRDGLIDEARLVLRLTCGREAYEAEEKARISALHEDEDTAAFWKGLAEGFRSCQQVIDAPSAGRNEIISRFNDELNRLTETPVMDGPLSHATGQLIAVRTMMARVSTV